MPNECKTRIISDYYGIIHSGVSLNGDPDTYALARELRIDGEAIHYEECRLYEVTLSDQRYVMVLADSEEAAMSQAECVCSNPSIYPVRSRRIPFLMRGWSKREF